MMKMQKNQVLRNGDNAPLRASFPEENTATSDDIMHSYSIPSGGFLVAPMVKSLPRMQETWFQALGQEDPLERGMTTHSSILA